MVAENAIAAVVFTRSTRTTDPKTIQNSLLIYRAGIVTPLYFSMACALGVQQILEKLKFNLRVYPKRLKTKLKMKMKININLF